MVLVTLADVISFTVSALIPYESRAVNQTNMLVTVIALNLYVAPPHPPPPPPSTTAAAMSVWRLLRSSLVQ